MDGLNYYNNSVKKNIYKVNIIPLKKILNKVLVPHWKDEDIFRR